MRITRLVDICTRQDERASSKTHTSALFLSPTLSLTMIFIDHAGWTL